jgi:cytidylate kinase
MVTSRAHWTYLLRGGQLDATSRVRDFMIVAIDGPAGAGKSSIARRLAERLGFAFLDTGAMYRAVALAALRHGLGSHDEDAISRLVYELSIDFDGTRTLLDGEDVSATIRTSEVTAAVYLAADNVEVRQRLVELQRQIADDRDIVTEGRDQGTVAFPHAECKIFLTASRDERARRRYEELANRGETISFEEVLIQQDDRDQRDATRPVGALYKADDAVEVLTDGLTPEAVVDRLERIVASKRRLVHSGNSEFSIQDSE